MMRLLFVAIACTLVACGGDAPAAIDAHVVPDAADTSGCDGPPPPIEECVRGPAWAECGSGTGPPRFACASGETTTAHCRWFAGGCVAAEFVASECPATDLCCFEGAPYEDPRGRDLAFAFPVATATAAWGALPWDRNRQRAVALVLAPTAVAERPQITCSADSGPGPCVAGAEITAGRGLYSDGRLGVLVLARRTGIYPDQIVIEVFPGDDGATTALVCQVATTDYATGRCQAIEPQCAVSGTVTMPAFPTTAAEATALTIDLDVTLENGTTIVGHF